MIDPRSLTPSKRKSRMPVFNVDQVVPVPTMSYYEPIKLGRSSIAQQMTERANQPVADKFAVNSIVPSSPHTGSAVGGSSISSELSRSRLKGVHSNLAGFYSGFSQWAHNKHNLAVGVSEGYRSQERQNKLYAQGRTAPGNIVTKTLNSRHTRGKAMDIVDAHRMWGTGNQNDLIAKLARQYAKANPNYGVSFLGQWDKLHIQI